MSSRPFLRRPFLRHSLCAFLCVGAALSVAATATDSSAADSADAVDCSALYEKHLKTDLGLSYKEFDQTMGQGFRVLAAAGCSAEAADLIEAYIQKNEATEGSLRWHVAQLRASAGDYEAAIESARQSLSEKENLDENPFRWNDYVLATIAFMEGDLEKLKLHRDRVAEGKEAHFGNEMNLKLLDAMVKHFGKPYDYATSRREK